LLFQLGGQLEPLETIVPEAIEEAPELGQPLGAGLVEPARPFAALAQQPGLLEHGQVLGDGRARDLEARGDLTRAQLAIPHELEDLAPVRLGDGSGYLVHGDY
jgi:hypothetical protein